MPPKGNYSASYFPCITTTAAPISSIGLALIFYLVVFVLFCFVCCSLQPSDVGRNAYAGSVIGSGLSSTPVASQRIWQEHVQKELKYQLVRSEYTRNPATVLLLPEKPNDLRRELALRKDSRAESDRLQLLQDLKEKDPRAYEDVVGRLERADSEPRAKFKHPLTTSHAYGWDLEFAKRHQEESIPYTVPHTNADVTAFADKYLSNHGFNPFSTRQFKFHARPGSMKKV